MVTIIWDTWLKPAAIEAGLSITREIWSDLRGFDGYLSHEILIDQDHPGHIISLGHWRSRDDADQARILYAESPTCRRLTPLLARARERWVTEEDSASQCDARAA